VSALVCFFCHRPILGYDVAGRYEWRVMPEGSYEGEVAIYGKGAAPLKYAQGRLVRLSHGKCYHAWKKQGELAAARSADPSSQPRPESDWRPQDVLDVEDLKPDHEGNGDH
jgi:hypothetical protein